MGRFTEVKKIYKTATKFITSNEIEWRDYLNFAANIYKYNFDNSLLIYAQRPTATMVADFNIWNEKVGRRINPGTRSIAVFDTNDSNLKLNYLFDIKDTNGPEGTIPKLWSLNDELENKLIDKFNKEYNANFDSIPGLISYISEIKFNELLDNNKLENAKPEFIAKFTQTAIESIEFMIAARCGIAMPTDNKFKFINEFNTLPLTCQLGNIVCNASKDALKEIEKEIKEIERERDKNDKSNGIELHRKRRNIISPNPNIRRTKIGQYRPREVWSNGNEVSKGEPSEQIQFIIDGGEINGYNVESKRGSIQQNGSTNGADVEGRSNNKSDEHNGNIQEKRAKENGSRRNNTKGNSIESEIKYPYGEILSGKRSGFLIGYKNSLDEINKRIKLDEWTMSKFVEPIDVGIRLHLSKDNQIDYKYQMGNEVAKNLVEHMYLFGNFGLEELKQLFPYSKEDIKNLIEKRKNVELIEPQDDGSIFVGNYKSNENEEMGGLKTKFKNNIEAIKTLKAVESENRNATKQEQEILAKYVGWGGMPQVF